MNKYALFISIVLSSLAVACGSQVYIPAEETGTATSGPAEEGISWNLPEFPEEPGETTTATNPPTEEVALLVEELGPSAGGQIIAGQAGVFYVVKLTAVGHALMVNAIAFRLIGYTQPDGGPAMFKSAFGTFFKGFRMMDLADTAVLMGPVEIWDGGKDAPEVVHVFLQDGVYLEAGESVAMALIADAVPAEGEVAQGAEYVGNQYLATREAFQASDVLDLETAELLPVSAITPNTEAHAGAIKVVAP